MPDGRAARQRDRCRGAPTARSGSRRWRPVPTSCRRPRLSPRRLAARVAAVEPSRHAVGRAPSCGSPRSPTARCTDARQVAGGRDESIVQPEWAPDGRLHVVLRPQRLVEPLPRRRARTTSSRWRSVSSRSRSRRGCSASRRTSFCDGRVVDVRGEPDRDVAHRCDGDARRMRPVSPPSTRVATDDREVVFIGASYASEPDGVRARELAASRACIARVSSTSTPRSCRRPSRSRFPTGGATAHALFYAPANPDYGAPEGERPPLIVMAHGGPTGTARTSLQPRAALLDQSRVRRRRRQLSRQHRLRPRATAGARRGSGASPTSRTASRPLQFLAAGATSMPIALFDPRRQRRRVHGAGGARRSIRRVRRRAPATTASPISRHSPPTRTSSSRATSIASSGRTRRRATCTWRASPIHHTRTARRLR